METHGPLFHGNQAAVALIVRVLACLAEGLGIRATARGFEVDAHTVLPWLVEAAEHLRAFARYCLCEVPVEQVHLAEFYAVRRDRKAGAISDEEVMGRLERAPYWGWTARDPKRKLGLVVDSGTRTLARAQRVVHQRVQGLAPGCVPLFLTAGCTEYGTAILPHCGHGRQPERRRDTGPRPKPRWRPLPHLLSAPVVKTVRRWRLLGGKHRVVFGTLDRGKQGLAACGGQSNPACVERLNLDMRSRVAAVGRRGNTLCQGAEGLLDQLVLFQTSHNLVVPHASLRQPLQVPAPTNGSGSAKVWQPWTPAMAAGLTAQVWSLQEVLLRRVPPWPHPQVR